MVFSLRQDDREDEDPSAVVDGPEVPEIPQTPQDLMLWLRELLPTDLQHVIKVINRVFANQRRAADRSRHDALVAMAQSMKEQIASKDEKISNIGEYFEAVVAELQQKAGLDPNTQLLNLRAFTERLEVHLGGKQRAPWCGIGVVDITDFKWINDTLGHPLGDKVIEKIAKKLTEQVRSEDVVAHERRRTRVPVEFERRREDLHARYGGDEFCFLIPDLDHKDQAVMIAQRFADAIREINWVGVDQRLIGRVKVDVGVVCLRWGRRGIARRLAHELIKLADDLMYDAKGDESFAVRSKCVEVGSDGSLVDLSC